MKQIASKRGGVCLFLGAILAGCQGVSPQLAKGPDAIAITGAANPRLTLEAYALGPADIINVNVAYEPDLTINSATIDTNGEVSVPLAGPVLAAGKTANELAQVIEARLRRYVKNPQVTVNVTKFARQTVTVEGNVQDPGVYDVPGTSSLVQALAFAKGPTRVAALSEVIVFRQVHGQRMGAVFDLNRIRKGYEPDPLILGGDVVIVGFSGVKGAFRDFLTAGPALSVFRPY